MSTIEQPFYYPGLESYTEEEQKKLGSIRLERPEPLIKVDQLSYILFERPDLDLQESFMQDFGLLTYEKTDDALFMRGRDSEPYCFVALKGETPKYLGCGFSVNTRAELETLAAQGEGAGAIEPLNWPGGGERVRLTDPNGFIIDVIHGRTQIEPIPFRRETLPVNTPDQKNRVNRGQRAEHRATQVVRLGHAVHMVLDFDQSMQWYMKHLGIIASDVQCLADGTPSMSFTRLDRGDQPADHHTLAVSGGPLPLLLHVAFETTDIDEIGQGSQFLKSKGWHHQWGIGRHILGSQIFDYWHDPYGTEMEHYADGDVFTAEHPTGYGFFDQAGLWQWGDDYPAVAQPVLPTELLQPKERGDYLTKWAEQLGRPARPWIET